MILVTGATGKIGSQVVHQLAASGVPVRALVRDPAKAQDLAGANVELVQGDLMDPASLEAALQGVDRLFLLSPQGGDPLTMERAAVEAARKAGVKHIVKLAVLGTSPFSHVGFLRSHWQVEKLIESTGIDYTFLHPNHLMQHFIAVFGPPISGTSSFFAPMKDGKVSMVDTRDIAAVAVAALTEEGHAGRIYDITGPEAISYSEAADKLSAALGRRVMFVDVPPEAARQAIIGGGAPAFIADDVVGLYIYFSNGYGELVTDVVTRIGKKQPIAFDQFARDFAPAWQAPPAGAGGWPGQPGEAPPQQSVAIQGGKPMSAEENKAIVQRFYTEVLNGKNMEVADELLDPGFVDHAAPPHPGSDRDFLHQFWPHGWRGAFPDWFIDVQDMVAEGDKVVGRYVASGTHQGDFMGFPGSGKKITVTGMNLFRLADGKIVEEYGNMDMLALMQQLGAIPGQG